MPLPDYYAILDTAPDADGEAIQSAYRAQCKKFHPDTGQVTASVEMMKRINEAYAVLSDDGKRTAYDRLRRGSRQRRPRPPQRRGDLNLALGDGLELPLVRVPAGEFLMGAGVNGECLAGASDVCRAKLYPVMLPEFFIGLYPVTVAQYAAFANATRRPSTPWARRSYSYDPGKHDDPEMIARLDRNWKHPFGGSSGIAEKLNHPVTVVSWFDAVAFCQWAVQIGGLRVRLPTAAEWQKAARGADGRCYPWGDRPVASPGRCNCLPVRNRTAREDQGDTTPVGSFSPFGDSPYGCADMLGNVWEWTLTRTRDKSGAMHFPEPYRPDDGRDDSASRDFRLLMGGSFFSECTAVCCSSARDQDPMRARDTGFRICFSS